ncbi:probable glutathione S-transferase [Hevea brasiliensis]|nr:probable glutathione S-transferase [Hevea brasiliensis]
MFHNEMKYCNIKCLPRPHIERHLLSTFFSSISAIMAEADHLILLEWYPSSFAARVRIALAEKGLKYVSRPEDLINKSPLLLKMNPVNKQIPVLIHNGRPICDSMVIVQYIDEVWNHKSPLLPSDSYQRAHAKFWADYVDKKIFGIGASKKELIECFKILEEELGDKPYFGGESYGYVHLSLIPCYSSFYTYETLGKLSMAEECPKIVDWANRCLQKESVSKSLCDQSKFHEIILEISRGGPTWSSVQKFLNKLDQLHNS